MKKILSLLICITLIMSNYVMVCAASNSGAVNSTVNWELDNGTLRITGYGEMANDDNFYGWKKLSGQIVNIEVSEGITLIGRMAFWDCDRLKNVSLPSTLKIIEDNAFTYCTSLATINLPNNLVCIEREAFDSCYDLENITVPDSLVYVGYQVFDDTAWFKNQPDGQIYVGKVL